jgi:hypothetical protein
MEFIGMTKEQETKANESVATIAKIQMEQLIKTACLQDEIKILNCRAKSFTETYSEVCITIEYTPTSLEYVDLNDHSQEIKEMIEEDYSLYDFEFSFANVCEKSVIQRYEKKFHL